MLRLSKKTDYALMAMKHPECTKHLGPLVPGAGAGIATAGDTGNRIPNLVQLLLNIC